MVLAVKIGTDGQVVCFRQAICAPARMAAIEQERKKTAMSDVAGSDFDR